MTPAEQLKANQPSNLAPVDQSSLQPPQTPAVSAPVVSPTPTIAPPSNPLISMLWDERPDLKQAVDAGEQIQIDEQQLLQAYGSRLHSDYERGQFSFQQTNESEKEVLRKYWEVSGMDSEGFMTFESFKQRNTPEFRELMSSALGELKDLATGFTDRFSDVMEAEKAAGLKKGTGGDLVITAGASVAARDLGLIAKNAPRSILKGVVKAAELIPGVDTEFDDYLAYENYREMTRSARTTMSQAQEMANLLGGDQEGIQKLNEAMSFIADPAAIAGFTKATKLGSVANKIALKGAAKSSLLRVGTREINLVSKLANPTAQVMEKMGRVSNAASRVVGDTGLKVGEFAAKNPGKAAAIGAGAVVAGDLASDGEIGAATYFAGGAALLGLGKVRGAEDIATAGQRASRLSVPLAFAGNVLEVGGDAVRNRYGSLNPVTVANKLHRNGVNDLAYRAMASTIPRHLVHHAANLTDNAIQGALTDGVFGYLATGTAEGAITEGTTGMVLGNAGYYAGRGVVRVKTLVTNGRNVPRGATVGLQNDPMVREADSRMVSQWTQTLDVTSQENLRTWSERVDADGGDSLAEIRNAMDAALFGSATANVGGQDTQVRFLNGEEFARAATAERFGPDVFEQWSQDSDSPDYDPAAIYTTQSLESETPGQVAATANDVTAQQIADYFDWHSENQQAGFQANMDDGTGNVLPAAIINTDAKKGLVETVRHEMQHVLSAMVPESDADGLKLSQMLGEIDDALIGGENAIFDESDLPVIHDRYWSAIGLEQKWDDLSPQQRERERGRMLNELRSAYFEDFLGIGEGKGGIRDAAREFARRDSAGVVQKAGNFATGVMRTGLERMGVATSIGGTPFDGSGRAIGPEWAKGLKDSSPMNRLVADYVIARDRIQGTFKSADTGEASTRRVSRKQFHTEEFIREQSHLFSGDQSYPDGSPRILSQRQLNTLQKKRGEQIRTALQSLEDQGAISDPRAIRPADQGSFKGLYFTDEQLAVIEPTLPRSVFDKLDTLNTTMRTSYGESVKMDYFKSIKSGTKREYGSFEMGSYFVSPFGFRLDQQGNLSLQSFDLIQFDKKFNAEVRKKNSAMVKYFGDAQRFHEKIVGYLERHKQGLPGAGKDGGIEITPDERDRLNAWLGIGNAEQTTAGNLNPGKQRQNAGLIKSFRVDRIASSGISDGPFAYPINYGFQASNFSPDIRASQENITGSRSDALQELGKPETPFEIKQSYHDAISDSLIDPDTGEDGIAALIGIESPTVIATGPSLYNNGQFVEVNPVEVLGGFESREAAETYAVVRGIVTNQNAVAGYQESISGSMESLEFSEVSISPEQAAEIGKMINFPDDIAFYQRPDGLVLVRLGFDERNNFDNFAKVGEDISSYLDTLPTKGKTDTFYHENEFTGQEADFAGFREFMVGSSSREAGGRLQTGLASRIFERAQAVNERFARDGLGDAGDLESVLKFWRDFVAQKNP